MDKEESNFFTNWKYWYVLAFAGLCLVFFLNYVVSPAIKFYGGSNAAIFFGVIIASGVFIYCLFSLVAEYGLIQAREEEEKKPSPEKKAESLFSEGWRFWKNSREIIFNNQTVGGTSLSVENTDRGEKFINEVFDLVGEKIENIIGILKILGQMTEEEGY